MDMKNLHNTRRNQRQIHFGVMCNGTKFQAWQARCLEHLLAMENVKPALLIIDDDAASQTMFDKIRRLRFNKFFFQLYLEFFVRPDAIREIDMSDRLSKIPSLHCRTIKKGKFSQYFSEADIKTIREYDLDFIIRFGFGIVRGDILDAALYGIWSYHHDDEEKYRGVPPCFWEICNGDNVTGAILQRLTDNLDAGIVLKKGYLSTINFSYAMNVNAVFFESSRWVSQVCTDILNGNSEYVSAAPSRTKAPIYYAPGNLQMMAFLIKMLKNFLFITYNNLFCHDQWNIGIVHEPIQVFLRPGAKYEINYLPHPENGKFVADPFGILKNKKLTILYEEFDYRSYKGIISWIDIDPVKGTSASQARAAIELPVHMSHPYLLEHNGEIYCIPETSHDRKITLYKAQEFPNKWIKAATLINDIAGVDATVFQYDGRWWLTCTDVDMDECLNLLVYHAPYLTGPWIPHTANPVKTDIRSARPAGTPFMYNGHLYRPSQDCSKTYGGRIVLNRVIRLTPTEFKEEPEAFIEPFKESPFHAGVHTVSSAGNFTLLDGKRVAFFGSAFRYALVRGLMYFLRDSRKK